MFFFRPYLIRFLRLLLFQFEPTLLALLFDLFGRALLRAPLLRPEPSRQRDEDRHRPADRAPRREDRGDEERRHGERRQKRPRSEEHTSELQSLAYLVCRLL